MKTSRYILFVICCLASLAGWAQNGNLPDDIKDPVFAQQMKVGLVEYKGEEIPAVELPNTLVYPELKFTTDNEWRKYYRLVRDVKKTLPIAKQVNGIIIETYEYLEKLPNKKAKDAHMKLVEKGIRKQYTPQMKKLTFRQGKLLIKLVNRECNSSGYELIKAFLGPVKAGIWQAFAFTFGASLTKKYNPDSSEEDALTERVIRLVESGQL